MKTAGGSFAQCFNAQTVADADHQVIIATDLNNCAADRQTLTPMMEQARRNTGRAPNQALADAGYCSEANLEDAVKLTEQDGTQVLIAAGRLGHDEVLESAPRGRIPKDLTRKPQPAKTPRSHRNRRSRQDHQAPEPTNPSRTLPPGRVTWTACEPQRSLPQRRPVVAATDPQGDGSWVSSKAR